MSVMIRRIRWIAVIWALMLIAAVSYQFWLGFEYNSNETTNVYLQLARGSSFALLVLLTLLWLPVMRNTITWLRQSHAERWLPLDFNRRIHRWLGHSVMAVAMLHGSQYLVYYDSLEPSFDETLFGHESDIVRAMQTTMYEFVSEDESIEQMAAWIAAGRPDDRFQSMIKPMMQEDCTKCHSRSSTQTWAVKDIPLSTYEDVSEWTWSGVASKQFRVNVSGIVMWLLMALIWFTSLNGARKKQYHRFQFVHRLGYLLVGLLFLHLPYPFLWLCIPLLLLVLDTYLSNYRKKYCRVPANIELQGDDVFRVTIERPDTFRIDTGHYIQLRVPSINRYEWHAFSLVDKEKHSNQLVLKIRALGDWTQQLSQSGEVLVDIRGPFASPIVKAKRSRSCLLVAGGIGITPFLGLLRHSVVENNEVSDVHLVWVLRDPHLLTWLESIIDLIWLRSDIQYHWHLYITSEAKDQADKLWQQEIPSNLQISLHSGRPEWAEVTTRVSESLVAPHCFICGPTSFAQQAAVACQQKKWLVTREDFQ